MNYNYYADSKTSNSLILFASDQVLRPYTSSKLTANRTVLIMVGVKAKANDISYSLLNFGPSAISDSYLKTIDLGALMKGTLSYRQVYNFTSPSVSSLNSSFFMFKHFIQG